eukprot:3555230-Pyramimonas_sp.AAC.1
MSAMSGPWTQPIGVRTVNRGCTGKGGRTQQQPARQTFTGALSTGGVRLRADALSNSQLDRPSQARAAQRGFTRRPPAACRELVKGGPIRRRKRGYILTADQSYPGSFAPYDLGPARRRAVRTTLWA